MKLALILEDIPATAVRQEKSLIKLGFDVDKNDGTVSWDNVTDIKSCHDEGRKTNPVDQLKQRRYNLLVIDLGLKGVTGQEILRDITLMKHREPYQHMKEMRIIVSTAQNRKSTVYDICKRYNPNAYLVKQGYQDEVFEEKVRELFAKDADLDEIRRNEEIDIREEDIPAIYVKKGNIFVLPPIVGSSTTRALESMINEVRRDDKGANPVIDFSVVTDLGHAGLRFAFKAKSNYRIKLVNFSMEAAEEIKRNSYDYLLKQD